MARKTNKPSAREREPSGSTRLSSSKSGAGPRNASDAFPPFPKNPRTFLITAIVLFLLSILLFAQNAWSEIFYRLLTDGILCLLWIISAFGWGAFLPSICKKKPSASQELSQLFHLITATALGLGILSLLTLAAGSLHRAYPITGWLLTLIGLALAVAHLLKHRSDLPPPLITHHSSLPLSHYALLAIIPLASLILVATFVPPGILWGDEPNGYDVLEYHLELPREWFQTHSTAPTTTNVFSNFPLLVESHYLLAMQLKAGPWAGMYLAQLMHLSFFVLTILAIYAFARTRSAEGGPKTAVLPTLLIATSPWIALLAPIAYNEGGLLLFGTLALIYSLRALNSDTPMRDMILAGVFTGLACSSKLTAVPTLLVFIPLALVVSATIQRAWGKPESRNQNDEPAITPPIRHSSFGFPSSFGFRHSGFVIAALLTFSPWLLRTYLATGNPVFPELTTLFSPAHFSPDQITRWHNANHLPNPLHRSLPGRLSELLNQIIVDWRYAFTMIPLALFAAVTSLLPSSLRRSVAPSLFLLIHLILLTTFWLLFTHLQSRFYILAIPVTALLLTQLRFRHELVIAAVLITLQIAISTSAMIHRFQQRIAPLLPAGAIGMENMIQFLPEEISPAVATNKPLALVGDAKAFLYQLPIQRLHYRTVFDAQAKPNQSILDAWLAGAAPDSIVIVDPIDLERFSKTYHAIPPLPETFPYPRDRIFILQPPHP